MPDLPEVTQTFDANVAPYLAGIEEMISATDDLKTAVEELAAAIEAIPDKTIDIDDESVKTALADVEALHAAIDALPDEKTIDIDVDQKGTEAAPGQKVLPRIRLGWLLRRQLPTRPGMRPGMRTRSFRD